MRSLALLCAAAWGAGLAAASPASPGPVQGLAEKVAASRNGVDAALGSLTGGPLSRALADAALKGKKLRLLLDPSSPTTRSQGFALAALSPSAQVRWSVAHPILRRWMRIDDDLILAWYPGAEPKTLAPGASERIFEEAWAGARSALSESTVLNDQLESLPDPRENTPHYVRRRSGGAP